MNLKVIWLALVFGCSAFPAAYSAQPQAPAQAASSTSEPYADQVKALADAQRKIGDLAGEFSLAIQGAAPGGGVWKAQGRIALAAGRRYRVEYVSPEPQLLVSDGKERWLYLKKINQVQKQALPPAGNPGEFFLELGGGLADWLQRCKVTRVAEAGKDAWEYTCVPRPGEDLNFQRARIKVAGPLRLPVKVEIETARPVTLVMKNVKVHTLEELRQGRRGLSASLFEFKAPDNAEVIEPIFP